MEKTENLFSYGTLRYEKVQLATFGRKLEGKEDSLPDYYLEKLEITDPDVITKSGENIHSIIRFSGNFGDRIPGVVFKVSLEELDQADKYEVARNHGIVFTITPDTALIEGIDAVRNILNRCWFDEIKCELGIKALENYKKDWNDRYGCWSSRPLHNFASHGADAFRMMAVGLGRLENKGLTATEWRQLRAAYM